VDKSAPAVKTILHLTSYWPATRARPNPGTRSYERDAELLVVGRHIRRRGQPAIVAGDMNDVGWSRTSRLFQRYSGLLDPRRGRGLYNTYSTYIPLFRYPLDHSFLFQ